MSAHRYYQGVACGIACSLSASMLTAQTTSTAASQPLDRATVRAIVDSVAALVALNYVVPDTGKLIAAHLRRGLASGTYDKSFNKSQLIDFLTRDLKQVNGDLHLYVRPADASDAGASGPVQRIVSGAPGVGGSDGGRGAGGGGGGGPTIVRRGPTLSESALAQVRSDNFNIDRADRLDGNVGYLALSLVSSTGGGEAFRVIDAAMTFLERTDAMIIDVRQTRGGDPVMSDYIASYFLADSTPTLNSYSRGINQTDERRASAVPGKKRTDVPLYILIGPGTASGAEDLAFALKQSGRAVLVGERSAGAGRPTRFYSAGNGLQVSISAGRTYDPRTNKEWEQIGIQPDMAASGDALLAAHAEALKQLAAAATDPARERTYAWTRDIMLARVQPLMTTARDLTGYAGTYNLREISVQNGKLYLRTQPGRPAAELVPVAVDVFGLGIATKVEFVRTDGRVSAVRLLTPDGQISQFSRNAAPVPP